MRARDVNTGEISGLYGTDVRNASAVQAVFSAKPLWRLTTAMRERQTAGRFAQEQSRAQFHARAACAAADMEPDDEVIALNRA